MKNILYTAILVIITEYSGVLAQSITDSNSRTAWNSNSLDYSNFLSDNNLALLQAFIKFQLHDTLRVRVVDQLSNSIFKADVQLWKTENLIRYDSQARVTNEIGLAEFDIIESDKKHFLKVVKTIAVKDTNFRFEKRGITELTVRLNNPPVPTSSLGLNISLFDKSENEVSEKRRVTLKLSGLKSYEFDATSKQSEIVEGVVEGKYSIEAVYGSGGGEFYDAKNKRYISLKQDFYTSNMPTMNLKPGFQFFTDLIYNRTEKLAVNDVERPGGASSKAASSLAIPAFAASPFSLRTFGIGFETGFVLPRTAIRSSLFIDKHTLDQTNENDFQLILFNAGPSYHFAHAYKFHFFTSLGLGYEYFKKLDSTNKNLSSSLSVGVQYRYFHLLGGTQGLYIQFDRFFTGKLDAAITLGLSGTIRIGGDED